MSAKDKLRGNSRTNIFVRVMVSFLLIILVPTMIMGIVWYRDIREKNHGDMMEKERRCLAEVQEAYRCIVSSVEQDLVGMVYGTSFQNYVATKKPEHMVQVMAEAARAVNRNESLYSVYLCDLGAGKIWDSGSKQQSLESFYDTNWLELGSEFVGMENFIKIWKNQQFWNSIRNTLILNLATLAASFPLTIGLALMLNELRAVRFKRISQSLLYLPHFISWVVVAGIAQNMFNMSNGTVNKVLEGIGVGPIPFLSHNGWWIFTYILCNIWKEIGWGTIIYLAALTSVDESLYEAAYLDGADRKSTRLNSSH